MDWLQKLNADYVTQTNSDNTIKVERSALEEPDSSTSCDTNSKCDNCSQNASQSREESWIDIAQIMAIQVVEFSNGGH